MIRRFLIASSAAALGILILLPVLYFFGIVGMDHTVWGLNLATLGWFLTAPFWMRKNR